MTFQKHFIALVACLTFLIESCQTKGFTASETKAPPQQTGIACVITGPAAPGCFVIVEGAEILIYIVLGGVIVGGAAVAGSTQIPSNGLEVKIEKYNKDYLTPTAEGYKATIFSPTARPVPTPASYSTLPTQVLPSPNELKFEIPGTKLTPVAIPAPPPPQQATKFKEQETTKDSTAKARSNACPVCEPPTPPPRTDIVGLTQAKQHRGCCGMTHIHYFKWGQNPVTCQCFQIETHIQCLDDGNAAFYAKFSQAVRDSWDCKGMR